MSRKTTGALGEKMAQDYLKKKGCKIIETNYRCPKGEIDIVARDGDCLVLCEVRTKTNLLYGTPEESITPTKIQHLEACAHYYRQTHSRLPASFRIDVIAIELDSQYRCKRLEWLENALED
jgi:putative endonuclease